MTKSILKTLAGQKQNIPPVWLMRQAGRHLPEYLKLRASEPDFISFCFNPEKAAEATLQPIWRYKMDAAILFADILLIPGALGQSVRFEKGIGPILDPITVDKIDQLEIDGAETRLSPIYETVSRVAAKLPEDTALIGFCGGPWTVATYMIEGKGTPNKEIAKSFAYMHPEAMNKLLNILADSSAAYLIEQAKAGAEALKIFESWAENLSPAQFEALVIQPTRRIISKIRAAGIDVPIIGFPRGAGLNAVSYAHQTGITALAIGTDTSLSAIASLLPQNMPVQGNLDPLLLRRGGKALELGVSRVLEDSHKSGRPHIFNLGHGVAPDVKIENVMALLDHIRTGNGNYV